MIILGGPISIAGDFLLPSIKQSVNKRAMHEIVIQTEINISAFGTDASVIGAVAVVVDDILTNPIHIEKEVVPGKVLDLIST
jgi:N-acetylglucosamine repressor